MTSKHFFFFSTLVCLLVIVGCGPGGPPVQFIEGTVSVDGKSIDNCSITFCPIDTSGDVNDLSRPLMAGGYTDEKGYYRVSAVQGGAGGGGTTVGKYNVILVKKEDTTVRPSTDPRLGLPQPSEAAMRPKYRYDTPVIFELQETTPITVEVKKGKNRFDFDLKSDGTFTVNGQ